MDWTGMEWIALSSPIVCCQSDGRDQLKWLANHKKPSLTHLIFKKHLLGDMYMSPWEKDE